MGKVFLGVALSVVLCLAAPAQLPETLHKSSIACIDFVYRENFKQAEAEARKLIKSNPHHPVGYFFCAVAMDAWMAYYQTSSKEQPFYEMCDQAIEKGQLLLDKDPTDPWAKFFIGGANGTKGTYESRMARWITAFRFGWQGVSILSELQQKHPEIVDCDYGSGCYDYWRSAMAKGLMGLPGVEDKRPTGIAKLVKVKNAGTYTKIAASVNLLDIYLNEKRWDDAIALSLEMQKQFPFTLAFAWPRAKALLEKGKLEESERLFRYILDRIEGDAPDNHYNGALCHYYLAKIAMGRTQFSKVIAESNRMNGYAFAEDARKRLEVFLKEAAQLKDQAIKKRSPNPDPLPE